MRRRLLPAALIVALAFAFAPAHAGITQSRSFVTSFDGTPIVYNLFLPDTNLNPAPWPVVLNGHGWGGSGSTSSGGFTGTLLSNGYAVLTWDSRGFGQSGGEAYVDDPAHEVRDVQALMDMLQARPDIANVGGDPLVGMIGGSYAGGIQLATAAFDSRVDAIIPSITWNDLNYSLYPGGVTKLGFDEGLYATGLVSTSGHGAIPDGLSTSGTAGPQAGFYSTDLNLIEAKGLALGYADPGTASWFRERSVAGYGNEHPVKVPTLLLQGSTDALFNVNEAVANLNHVVANGAPAKLMLFCGGHVGCNVAGYNPGPTGYTDTATLAWLDRYVKGLPVSTGAPLEYVTNDGVWHQSNLGFDKIPTGWVTAANATPATLVSSGAKTSVINGKVGVTYATPSDPSDPGTLTIPTTILGGQTIAGIPKITLTVGGAGSCVHLFVKLVDRELNQVIDLQEAATRVELIDPLFPQTIRFNGVGVAYTVPTDHLPSGDVRHHVDVQISTSSGAMSECRGAALLSVTAKVAIPTV